MTKKVLDLSGLQRYNDKLKNYVTEKVSECSLNPIPSADVEKLFNSANDASTSENKTE